ncbi:hypothetical protein PIROE2DRAFT_61436 [Piromyces sp. E2]|nr:hypothetical protein PIROE2DRAFT_61436 [Piromyces sp. E2]|eukprot:OUM63170.1 hypothetical protein PIROE2DRAFT_61436 [Piromyces sp. E2]
MSTSTLNNDLMKILLKRRNMVIINDDKNIYDIFKDEVTRCIFENKDLKECCEIKQFNEDLSVTIKINGIPIDFGNGIYIYMKNKKETEFPIDLATRILTIVNEKAEKIKAQMIYALSLNENIGNLGYCMDQKMFNIVAALPKEKVKTLSDFLISSLKEMVGADVRYYRPLYPDFPSQVIDMKDSQLYYNALIHYWFNGTYKPYKKMNKRNYKPIKNTYKNITIGKEDDLHQIMTNIMCSSETIFPKDIEDLTTYCTCYKNFLDTIPERIPNKENLAIITNMIININEEFPINKISRHFDIVTDVLRLAAVMSNESPTLKYVRFKSFSNKERRILMSLLNNCRNRVEDFCKYKNMWQRVCERIHPMKIYKLYPDLVDDMVGSYKYVIEKKKIQEQLHNINKVHLSYKENDTHQTFAARVEKLLNEKKYDKALTLLAQRPGIFSRRLDELLMKVDDQKKVLEIFEEIASKVSVKVLLSLKGYFQKRHEKLMVGVFLIKETYTKGSRFDISYKQITEEEHEMAIKELEEEISSLRQKIKENNQLKDQLFVSKEECENESEILEIIESIKKIDKDNTEINEKIENALINIDNHRNEEENKNINKIRLFIWWTNTKNGKTIDIDLSIMIYDENLKDLGHVSYTSLKNDTFKIYHSGDITNGGDVNGNGAAEFIDFDPKQIIDCHGRYIAVSVNSFNGEKFKDLDNCKFRWMEREDLNSNDLFDPKTVKQKLDLNIDCTSTVPVVFDCKTNEFVWIDTSLTENLYFVNIENSKTPMNGILYYYLNPLKDNLYNLFKLHVQSRGGRLVESVNELSEGDTAFVSCLPYKRINGVKYIRPVDLDIILSEYMTTSI